MRTAKYKQAMQLQFTLLEDQRNRFSYIYNNVYNIVYPKLYAPCAISPLDRT